MELKPIDNTVGWSNGFELRTIQLMATLASTAINLIQLVLVLRSQKQQQQTTWKKSNQSF